MLSSEICFFPSFHPRCWTKKRKRNRKYVIFSFEFPFALYISWIEHKRKQYARRKLCKYSIFTCFPMPVSLRWHTRNICKHKNCVYQTKQNANTDFNCKFSSRIPNQVSKMCTQSVLFALTWSNFHCDFPISCWRTNMMKC